MSEQIPECCPGCGLGLVAGPTEDMRPVEALCGRQCWWVDYRWQWQSRPLVCYKAENAELRRDNWKLKQDIKQGKAAEKALRQFEKSEEVT
jgi:hypothetical protein